jgi:hypothetical protein
MTRLCIEYSTVSFNTRLNFNRMKLYQRFKQDKQLECNCEFVNNSLLAGLLNCFLQVLLRIVVSL